MMRCARAGCALYVGGLSNYCAVHSPALWPKDDGSGPSATEQALARIEAKLDTLIASLADGEEEDQPSTSLDGTPAGRERDATQSLG